jgi:hypothetical protein
LKSHPSFSEVDGPIKVLEDKRIAEHIGPDFVPGSFRINEIYSKEIHYVRLSFEQPLFPNTFIGIIEAANKQSISSSHGWFIGEEQLIYHKPGEFSIVSMLRK